MRDLETAEKLIREASDILHRIPVQIYVETGNDAESTKVNGSDSDKEKSEAMSTILTHRES